MASDIYGVRKPISIPKGKLLIIWGVLKSVVELRMCSDGIYFDWFIQSPLKDGIRHIWGLNPNIYTIRESFNHLGVLKTQRMCRGAKNGLGWDLFRVIHLATFKRWHPTDLGSNPNICTKRETFNHLSVLKIERMCHSAKNVLEWDFFRLIHPTIFKRWHPTYLGYESQYLYQKGNF